MTTPVAPCGTRTARVRHTRNNETCQTCDAALKTTLAPCGTRAAKRRHAKRGETCAICEEAMKTHVLQPCGTPAAHRRHKKNGETPCDPCVEAIREHDKARAAKKRTTARVYNNLPIEELTDEILFLLNSGEGTARILEATGYVGREKSLATRLGKAGRSDLIPRIFTPWDLAA